MDALKKYAEFDGRATRAEFWYFVLFDILIAIGVAIVATVIGFRSLSTIYTLAVLILCFFIKHKTAYDIGKSGWMILVGLIPVVGAIWLIILYAKDTTTEPNLNAPQAQ